MNLSKQQWRIIRRIQKKKWPVTDNFLRTNLENVVKYINYGTVPRVTIKSGAVRRTRTLRTKEHVKLLPFIYINYYMLRRVVFDKARRSRIKERLRNVRAWSKNVVDFINRKDGVQIYEEDQHSELVQKNQQTEQKTMDLTKKVKEQLELLKAGKRATKLIDSPVVKARAVNSGLRKTAELPRVKLAKKTISNTDIEPPAQPLIKCAVEPVAEKQNPDTVNVSSANVTDSEDLPPTLRLDVESDPCLVADKPLPSPINASTNKRAECTGQFVTPEKQLMKTVPSFPPTIETRTCRESDITDENDELSASQSPRARPMQFDSQLGGKDSNSNILDLILNKVAAKKQATSSTEQNVVNSAAQIDPDNEQTDGSEEFAGFEDTYSVSGMLDAPQVPQLSLSKEGNPAFESTSLDDFMRTNALEPGIDQKCSKGNQLVRKHRQANLDGLVTPFCTPPPFLAPMQPEGLQKQRTVAERRNYLQKNARNHRLAIINNECHIYRELNRKMRLHKGKSAAQEALQAPGSHMYFTRYGWQAASFVTTEFNKYYYQKMQIVTKNGITSVKLPGVRGNNEDQSKPQHRNYVPKRFLRRGCGEECIDQLVSRDFRPCASPSYKSKLNSLPLKNDFKPSPLRFKPLQKPTDDDTAAMLLAGGGMVVVEMPAVTLEVFPEITKTLDEVARRYLAYIQPSDSVTSNWASMCASTLFASYEEASAAAKKGEQDRKNSPQSFVFAVPYQNDRSKLLVRRVFDRSAPLLQDPYFAQPNEPCGKELDECFTFRQSTQLPIANDDERTIADTCKDFLGDMIVSVAISCGENSLSVEDVDVGPDHAVNIPCAVSSCKNNDKATPTEASKRHNRLFAELKRLNASIIDASSNQSEETITCTKGSCRLGCICQSLAAGRPPREHCGKAKCVLKCECKGAHSSKVIRIDTDLSGRSLTTEAAFRLRRKVTQKLAPMEKEFTSTVVITGSETLLINESHHDRKRRCTKKPKHYDDFDNQDAVNSSRQSLSPTAKNTSSGALVSIEVNDEHTPANTSFSETTTELRQPIYLKDTDMEKMKHCRVSVPRMKDIQNMAFWCMVHGLYKCFCGAHSVDGKPVVIDRENNVTMVANGAKVANQLEVMDTEDSTPMLQSMNVVDSPQHFVSNNGQQADENVKDIPTKAGYDSASESSECELDDNDPEFKSKAKCLPKKNRNDRPERRGRPSDLKFKISYLNCRLDTCRRAVQIPSKTYHRFNRKRIATCRQEISASETPFIKSLLTEHMLRSVFHYKAEKAKERELIRLASEEASLGNKTDCVVVHSSTSDDSPEEDCVPLPLEPVRLSKQLDENSEDVAETIHTINSFKRPANAKIALKRSAKTSPLKQPLDTNDDDAVCSLPKLPRMRANKDIPQEAASPTENVVAEPVPDVPRITGCYSLQEGPEFNGISFSNFVSFQDGMRPEDIRPILQPSDLPEHTRGNFHQFFNSVVTNMNSLVSKKMQDIDQALKRESLFIPDPHEDVLCIMRWTNFLKAYLQGSVHVWDVKKKKRKYLVATMTNVMPLVPGALAVSNLRAIDLRESDFRMFSIMLIKRCFTSMTEKLAVLMQGCTRYWTIKGFLWPDPDLACGKPTPETHPLLTKKINQLCGMLVAQRIKEYQQKHNLSKASPPADQIDAEVVLLQPAPRIQLEAKNRQFVPVVHSGNKQPSQVTNISLPPTNISRLNSTVPPLVPTQIKPLTVHLSPNFKPNAPTYMVKAHASRSPIVQQGGKYRPLVPSPLAAQPPHPAGHGIPRHLPFSDPKPAVTRNGHNPRKMRQDIRIPPHLMNITRSNLTYRRVTMNDVAELYTPEAHTEDHRWMVLDLRNDFSHILVPDFCDLVSLDRISKVLSFANARQKTVKLQFFDDAQYDAFVTPLSQTKVYFGPLREGVEAPVIILLQSVDGRMMLREEYQRQHNITLPPEESTSAFWLMQTNHRLRIDMEDEKTTSASRARPLRSISNAAVNDDCIVIDDSDDEDVAPQANVLPHTNELPQATLSKNVERVNFTIQSTDENQKLQITSNGRNQLTASGFIPITMPPPGTIIQLPGTTNPPPTVLPSLVPINKGVITSVTAAPKEASYGSTVYITLPNESNLKQLEVTAAESATAPVDAEDNEFDHMPPPDKRPRSASVGAIAMDTINNSLERVSELFAEQSEPTQSKVTILSDMVLPPDNETATTSLKDFFDSSDSEVRNEQPTKMRRISIRGPATINNNAKDIALEAVFNMMPPAATSSGKDFVEVVDDLLTISEGDNQPKTEAPHPPKILPTKLNNTADRSANTVLKTVTPPLRPTVFDVDFLDEPSASIVVKPVHNITAKPVLNSNVPVKPALNKNISIKPGLNNSMPVKRLVNGAIKPGQPIRGKEASTVSDGQLAQHKIFTYKNLTATKASVSQPTKVMVPSTSAIDNPVHSSSSVATKSGPLTIKTITVKPRAEDPLKLPMATADGDALSGRMVAEALGVPQFEAKRMTDYFLVQIADTRCVRINTMEKVMQYLNQHVKKTYPECASKLPTKWKFYVTGRAQRDGPTIVFRSRPKPPTQPNQSQSNSVVTTSRLPAATTIKSATLGRPVTAMTIKGTTITKLPSTSVAKPAVSATTTALSGGSTIITRQPVKMGAPKAISLSGLRQYQPATLSPKSVQVALPTAANTQRTQKYFCRNASGELVALSATMAASVVNKLKSPSKGTGGQPVKIYKTATLHNRSSSSMPPTGPVRVKVLPVTRTVQKSPAASGANK